MHEPRKAKLAGSLDVRRSSCEGPCLTPQISAVNVGIPDILRISIVCRHVYKVTKNLWSKAENATNTEGQTCGIARYTELVGKKLSPHRPPLERRNGCR